MQHAAPRYSAVIFSFSLANPSNPPFLISPECSSIFTNLRKLLAGVCFVATMPCNQQTTASGIQLPTNIPRIQSQQILCTADYLIDNNANAKPVQNTESKNANPEDGTFLYYRINSVDELLRNKVAILFSRTGDLYPTR